ncbi:uncharacterized protein LOC124344460 [Daphnia pulicaria]|uniref:uncharacterized protein LOC124344460 n=1 Tax=Daphnia pulicaria TaxID=35523 RepID=UPI001EEA86C6|nr:uncharacterized protein LOC124344460 [Daphnia pulicaria]
MGIQTLYLTRGCQYKIRLQRNIFKKANCFSNGSKWKIYSFTEETSQMTQISIGVKPIPSNVNLQEERPVCISFTFEGHVDHYIKISMRMSVFHCFTFFRVENFLSR